MALSAAFQDSEYISCFMESTEVRSNYWLSALILDASTQQRMDALLALTNDEGIMTRPLWIPLHQQTMYTRCPRMDLSVTDNLVQSVINIPSSASLGGRL
ncbi:DegT/DnrJ/EryC1/StrS family aminotransferase [Paenibacillus sp. 1_12]|uniref:DegT/DnrJ/EryC1/StrS family aminotransferase n=1 Tax=Paenibacillus sp. 1_12 TaxID=1566278 RepID=UPI000B8541CD|nr:DegT/DnrJ/EryC1/StrS family aminotransferase [Paenibacillus sp. 1_12]